MATITEWKSPKTGRVSYQAKVRVRGFPAQRASFSRKAEAKDWALKTEAAIKEGRYQVRQESQKHLFHQLVDLYILDELPKKKKKTAKTQKQQLLWWKTELGMYRLCDLNPALVVQCRNKLTKGEKRPGKERQKATVNRYLSVLSAVFKFAVKELQWMNDNPCRNVSRLKECSGRNRFLSDAERDALLAACEKSANHYLRTIVVLALSTGMRRGEILNLRWAEVDLPRRLISLKGTKNGEDRHVPIVGLAHQLLKQLPRYLHTDLLFPGAVSVLSKTGEVKPYDIQRSWYEALDEAGLQDFRFHDLRHSCASYLAMNGCSPSEIAAVLGHKTLQMVKRYAHLSDQHTRAVVENMNEKIFGVR